MSDQKLVIVFALFPGVTQLDFTGPHLVFSRLPGATVILASRAGGTVEADGIAFAGPPRRPTPEVSPALMNWPFRSPRSRGPLGPARSLMK